MWFWWFLLICDILIPIIMIIAGKMMWKHSPKNINSILGYRTARSMKNMDTWKFAHEYCGRLWWKMGWITLIPSVVIHFPVYHASENTIGVLSTVLCAIQCVTLFVSVFFTERALKRTFTDEGMRKSNTL